MRLSRISAIVALAVVVMSVQGVAHAAPGEGRFTVDRVVDGDTVAGTWEDGAEGRIRFLNVDTPEVGTCLSAEATAFTKRELRPGTSPALTYDKGLFDPYGRVLAVVRGKSGKSLSVALARNGLGVPVNIAPNRAHYPAVVRASKAAVRDRVGFFDPRLGCTPAGHLDEVRSKVAQARAMPAQTKTQYAAVIASLAATKAALNKIRAARYGLPGPTLRTWIRAARKPLARAIATVRTAKTRAWRTARAEQRKPKPKPTQKSPVTKSPSYPVYNGPRCYAPGGKTWRPC
ncbi:thermonuclease family protein [Nocardioides houyundeii]|uniref:thermonuclease family protein n=1 Tax=Nocardioides houyundeii TaxID=2045452 RepID=UPI001315A5CE|nr:thermonuclease family protein [Nocardioides houyundeii]